MIQKSLQMRSSSESDTSNSETDEDQGKRKRREKRRAKRKKSGDRIIKINLDALSATHVAEGFHVIIQVMPKVPEAPKADLEPDAKAAEAEVAKE